MAHTLEGLKLGTTAIMVNPYELLVFDKIVGKGNRSKTIRRLIKEFNKEQERIEQARLGIVKEIAGDAKEL